MAKQVSMNRIRSELRNSGSNEYLGCFPDKKSLCEKYPERQGGGKKKGEIVGGKVFDDSSYAIIDDGKNTPIQMKYNNKGKWVEMGNSGSSPLRPSQQALIDAWSENDILYIGDDPSNPKSLDWKIIKVGVYLYSYQFVNGEWVEYQKIGGSTQVDTLILKGLHTAIYETVDDVKYNIWRKGSTPSSNVYGSTQRRVFILADGRDKVEIAYAGDYFEFDPSPIGTDKLDEEVMTFEFLYNKKFDTEVVKTTHNLYRPTKARLSVLDITDGEEHERMIYESMNEKEYQLNGGQLLSNSKGETTGTIEMVMNDRIFFIVGRKYRLIAQCKKGDCGFEGVNKFPWVRMQGNESLASMIATEAWISEQPFSKPQTLQQVLETNNHMNPNTNIILDGTENVKKYSVDHTTMTTTNGGNIELTRDGWDMKSLSLQTVTPKEENSVSIHLAPEDSPISPKIIKYRFYDVPQEPINLPANITFETLEMDGSSKTIPYVYTIDKSVTPYDGYFTLQLDGRQIKSLSITFHKFPVGGYPDFSKWGYLCEINGFDGESKKLFEKIDEQYKINPTLINESWEQIPDSNNIKPSNGRQITTDSIYRLAEDVVGKVEALPIDQRFDILKMKNVDTLQTGVFKGVMSSLDVLKDAKKGDYWKNTTTSKITLAGIDFSTNDELYCITTVVGTPTDLSKFQKVPFVSDRVQSDWSQVDSGSPEFIKNKPTNLVTEANSDSKAYGRKNKTWIPLTDIQEPLDTFQYLRTLGKWVKHEDKFNLCAFGDKKDYLKDEFASYNGKLYRALKNTFRSPDYTSVAKVDTGVPLTEPYNTATGTEYPQMQLFVPFVSNSNQSITGFRLNIETSSPIENSYVCLMERVMSSSGSVARVLTVEKFTANNGNLEYKLTTPLTVIKDKNYELFVLLPSAIPFKIMGSYMSVLENAIFKVGLVEGTPYSTAFDQRKLGDTRIPSVGSEYQNHQGTWTSGGIMCLTPIIESTTVKDWVEVVGGGTGGEVKWNDIIDKPTDILTDTILAETNRMHLTMDSHGQGLMASTDVPELPKIGLSRYDIPSRRVIVGNRYSDTVIQAGKRILSRTTGIGDTLFSNVGTTQVLSKPEFIIPFTPLSTTIVPTEFSIAVDKESTITLMVGDVEILSGYKLAKGKNNITLPLTEIPCKVGQKIDVIIQAGDIDKPCFMGEIIGEGEAKEEKLFYSFSYETYKDSTVMTSDLANRKLLLTPDAKIQIPNNNGNTLDIISLDGDMSFIGNMEGRMAILSKEKPFMGYAEEPFSLLSIDTEDQLPAKSYSATFKFKNKEEEYAVNSINLTITKPCMVRANINGVEYGDYRQQMPIGEITLKPVGSRMAMVSGEFTATITSAVAGVFIGNVSATPQIPKLTVNLHKPMISRIASETYAHKVNVDKMNETENIKENYRVTGNVRQIGIPIISNDIQYTVPNRCKPPRVNYLNQSDICFDGDYKMVTNEDVHEEFIVKFPPFKTGYSKIRVEAYFDVYKQSGFVPDMVAETEDAPKVFMANSASGNDLRETHHTVYCSKNNIEYHSFFDYYEGDQISFSFGQNVDFSNCYMSMDIHTLSDNPNGTSNMYDVELIDATGKIKTSAIQEGTFIERAEYNNTLRKINTIDGDNIYLNKSFVSTVFCPLEPQTSNSVSYEVAPNSKVTMPKMGEKNEYIATNLESCNIVGDDYLKFIISNFGGVRIDNQDLIKMVVRIYKLNQTTPIKYNIDSILLTSTNDYKLDYESVNNEFKDYYEIEYRINGAPTEFVMKVGDGNDWTNLSVVLFFAGLLTNKDEVPMFTRELKINPELYDGWDSKVNLVNGENVTVLTPNNEIWKHVDFNTIKVQTECIESQPEFRHDTAGIYIYYPANTVLQTAGQTIQYTIPVPKEFENNWVDIELCFDETRNGVPHINPDDFYVVNSGDSEKTVRQEYMTTILTIKNVPASADGTPVIIRGVAHPSSNSGTNISDCETRFITFRTNKNKPKETLMFVDNKINKELYDSGSGWDYTIDLANGQNVDIKVKQSSVEKKLDMDTCVVTSASIPTSKSPYLKTDEAQTCVMIKPTTMQGYDKRMKFTIPLLSDMIGKKFKSLVVRFHHESISRPNLILSDMSLYGMNFSTVELVNHPAATDILYNDIYIASDVTNFAFEIAGHPNAPYTSFSSVSGTKIYEIIFTTIDGETIKLFVNDKLNPVLFPDIMPVGETMRIRNNNGTMVFECYVGGKWSQMGAFN